MAYKQQQYIPAKTHGVQTRAIYCAKTYGVQTRAIYSCQDLWCTNNSNIFLPRLMVYKQQQYIPAKTYGVKTTAIYSC